MKKIPSFFTKKDSVFKKAPDFSPAYYKDLTKAKLSAFVLLTTMAGYAVAPGVPLLSTFFWTTIGTGLCVASANTINQWTEQPYDAQMSRTRNRVLVRHALTPTHAFLIGTSSGVVGTGLLACFVNPYAAILGFSNIILYTCIYTPMKRSSIYNTWPGAIVGAIPPMIGWVACTGSFAPGAFVLGFALYAWQFPHFNSLAWNLRPDYSKAGYQMMSVMDPALNSRVSLRYALAMFPISAACYFTDITTIWFVLDSSIVNAYMSYYAFAFWKNSNDSNARKLFFSSLVHLPVFLILLMIHKSEVEETKEVELE
ncbi:UbiA prenyltransferase family [Globomyces pollinis-pini]|nr:UbiA prenyltransferase family [Globomyces pollinis-pini]